MSTEIAAPPAQAPSVRPRSVHPLSNPCLSILQDDTSNFTARQRSPLTSIVDRYATAMEYSAAHPPPADWLSVRHRDTPCVFRATMSSDTFWTAEQRAAIREALRGWRDDGHQYHGVVGTTQIASTRRSPAQHDEDGRLYGWQRHKLGWWVRQTRRRRGAATSGVILRGVQVGQHPSTALFRRGPQHLHIAEHDVFTHSSMGTDLTLLAGQQHTHTELHTDPGEDSVWQLLAEGQKLWLVGRPECADAMRAALPVSLVVPWKRITSSAQPWMLQQRTMVVVQNAGDIVYLPAGWPHAVRHYTDTIAVNSNVLHAWHLHTALRTAEFGKMNEGDFRMYVAAMAGIRCNERLQCMAGVTMHELEEQWKATQKVREAALEERDRRCELEGGSEEEGDKCQVKRKRLQ